MTSAAHRAALMTAPGAGAIAIIRLEGPDPVSLLRKVFVHPKGVLPQPNERLVYGKIVDGAEVVDDVLVSVEVVDESRQSAEISCHGGVRVVQRILDLLGQQGVQIEESGHKLHSCWPAGDRIEEEALEALLGARTQRAVVFAAKLRTDLPKLIHSISADWNVNRQSANQRLGDAVKWFDAASNLLRGVSVALLGPPNSGKSTLYNTLVGRQAVVTSPVPGTTRDWVCDSIEFGGVPIDLIDTAGRHAASCELEQLAIDAGQEKSRTSQVVVFVFDGTSPLTYAQWTMLTQEQAPIRLAVANKKDLGFSWNTADADRVAELIGAPPLVLSARTGDGVDLLKKALLERLELFDQTHPPICFFTKRQLDLAQRILAKNEAAELFKELIGSQ